MFSSIQSKNKHKTSGGTLSIYTIGSLHPKALLAKEWALALWI